MKKILNIKLIFVLIVTIASLLRVYQLGNIPPGIHADEADTGYAAYNLLGTGLTQFGDFNPLALTEHNGGTHPPVYTYLLIPLIHFFDLNIFTERLPSVLSGIGLVIVFYFLTKELFHSRKTAAISSLLVALNPWAIHISRQGLLESVSLFFVVFGVYLFLRAKKNNLLYISSAISFGLSLHSYDAQKIVVPLLIIGLFFFRLDLFKKNKKHFLYFILTFLFFFLLMVYVLLTNQAKDYQMVSVISSSIVKAVDKERYLTIAPLWLSSMFHNKLTVSMSALITNYLEVFSANWLFKNGHSNLQQAIGGYGQFYLFEAPFFFIGIYQMLKKYKKTAFLLLFWFLISPLPGAITSTGNFPYRDILLLPIPIIFSAYGIIYVFNYFSSNNYKNIFIKLVIVIASTVFVIDYVFVYFFDYPIYGSEYWAKQENDAIKYAVLNSKKYDQVYIDGGLDWPIIYSFMEKTDPLIFQKAYKNKVNYKGIELIKINNYYFGDFAGFKKVKFASAYFPKKSLVITNMSNFTGEKSIKEFRDPEGVRVIFKAIQVK